MVTSCHVNFCTHKLFPSPKPYQTSSKSGDRKCQAVGRQVIKSSADQTKQRWCRRRQVSGEESALGAERSTPTAATSCLTCRYLAEKHTQLPPPPSTFCSCHPPPPQVNDPLVVTCRVSSIWNYWEILPLIQKYCFCCCFCNTLGSMWPQKAKDIILIHPPSSLQFVSIDFRVEKAAAPVPL